MRILRHSAGYRNRKTTEKARLHALDEIVAKARKYGKKKPENAQERIKREIEAVCSI